MTAASPALREAISQATPFGQLPKGYPHIKEFCREAHVAFRDEPTVVKDKEGKVIEEYTMRTWSVVADEAPVQGKGGASISANGHMKFKMIMDFLEFKLWQAEQDAQRSMDYKPDRSNVLSVAIGIEQMLNLPNGQFLQMGDEVRRMKGKTWRELNNHMSKIGVRGYNAIGSKTNGKVDSLPDFE